MHYMVSGKGIQQGGLPLYRYIIYIFLYYSILYPSVYNSSHSCQPASGLKPDIDLLTGVAIKRVGKVERNCIVHTYTHTRTHCRAMLYV